MKTSINVHEKVDYLNAGSAISSGDVVALANRIGIAHDDIAATTGVGPVVILGIAKVTKLAGSAWTQDEKIYYDTVNTRFTDVASGNQYAGLAAKAATSAATTGLLDLNAGQNNPSSTNSSPAGAVFTIGAPTGDVRIIGIQLNDADGIAVTAIGVGFFYFSDAATGIGVTGTGPSGAVAAGTDGAVIETYTAKKTFELQSEADGDIDLSMEDAGVNTWYLCYKRPDGAIDVSDAISMT